MWSPSPKLDGKLEFQRPRTQSIGRKDFWLRTDYPSSLGEVSEQRATWKASLATPASGQWLSCLAQCISLLGLP